MLNMHRARWRFKSVLYFLLVVALIATSIFFFMKYNNKKENTADPNAERKALIAAVSDVATLPSGTPAIETVTDATLLKAQPFFEDVKNGDKILIFTTAQQVIIYRPSTEKVINSGPLVVGTTTTTTTAAPTTTAPSSNVANIDVIARNNDSNQTTSRINTSFEGKVKVTQVSTTATIASTVVVVNADKFATLAKQIADALGGTVGTTPSGAPTSDADIVVYVRT